MKNVLLCSSNPILTKNLYGVLRDLGFSVETAEHPSHAVQKVMFGLCELLIIDSEPFGMSSDEAIGVVRSLSPDLPVLILGDHGTGTHYPTVSKPVDLEEFTAAIHRFAA